MATWPAPGPSFREPATVATVRVAAVALGRFHMADGRPADRPSDAAEMVAAFVPDTVPILSRHGGLLLGYLDTLRAEGADLHMTGTVGGWPDLGAVIGRGRFISIETVYGAVPLPGGLRYPLQAGTPLAVSHSAYRGQLALGLNLIGIAFTDRPAARGSVLWIVQ